MPATTRTETYDAVLTTTARHMQPTLRDNITRSNKLCSWLEMQGRIRRVSGGERIKIPLLYQLSTSADIFQGYGNLNTTPQDGITAAFYPWSQLAVTVVISGLERRQNSGAEQIMNLLQAKITQAENAIKELFNNCLVAGKISSGATGSLNQFVARTGVLDNSADGPLPLPALIDADNDRSVSIGDINGNTETYWRNQSIASTATTFTGYKREKNNLYNTCARGVGGPPDLIISDQKIWELYFNSLQSQERYFVTNQRIIDVLGGADDEALKFRGAVHIWDEVVSDVGTSTANVVDSIGTLTNGSLQSGAHSTEYHLNTMAFECIVHPEADFEMTPFITPVNQDATVAAILWQGQMTVNNRRKHGVLYDLNNSIAA